MITYDALPPSVPNEAPIESVLGWPAQYVLVLEHAHRALTRSPDALPGLPSLPALRRIYAAILQVERLLKRQVTTSDLERQFVVDGLLLAEDLREAVRLELWTLASDEWQPVRPDLVQKLLDLRDVGRKLDRLRGVVQATSRPSSEAGPREMNWETHAGWPTLPRRARVAWLQYRIAEGRGAKTDREAYDLLRPDYDLPGFRTWCSYVRKARLALGQQKYTKRALGGPTRSIRPVADFQNRTESD